MSDPGWFQDPTSRFELRYHDGVGWTEHASRAGQSFTDSIDAAALPPQTVRVAPAPSHVSSQGPVPIRSATNGLATAGMVVGILGVLAGVIPILFFIAFPLAVLALIFGLVGRSRAKKLEGHPGKGPALAGALLGSAGIVLATVGLVIVVTAVHHLGTSLSSAVGPADQADYEISGVTCTQDFGITMTGQIKNTTATSKSFQVNVEFHDGASTVRLDTGSTVVSDIEAGQSAQWDVTSFKDAKTARCAVVEVDNWFN